MPRPADPTDPGAAPFGNFINYYSFNSAEDRLRLLPDPDASPDSTTTSSSASSPTRIWSDAAAADTHSTDFVVLDIGCNAGNFTQLLQPFLAKHTGKTVYVLGVDIDAALIERAQQHNEHGNAVTYMCLDMMEPDADRNLGVYLRAHGKTQFDAAFGLSLTMWIHLNHGDDGLERFLSAVSAATRLLIIEPQPWKCYRTAVRRMRKADRPFERFAGLQWRQDVEEEIDRCVTERCGRTRVWQSVPTKWDRRIAIYSADCLDGRSNSNR